MYYEARFKDWHGGLPLMNLSLALGLTKLFVTMLLLNILGAVVLISIDPQLAPMIASVAALVTAGSGVAILLMTRRIPEKVAGVVSDTVVAVVLPTLKEILTAVSTMNAMSLAELADAVETRRILAKPESQRSDAEIGHLKSARQTTKDSAAFDGPAGQSMEAN